MWPSEKLDFAKSFHIFQRIFEYYRLNCEWKSLKKSSESVFFYEETFGKRWMFIRSFFLAQPSKKFIQWSYCASRSLSKMICFCVNHSICQCHIKFSYNVKPTFCLNYSPRAWMGKNSQNGFLQTYAKGNVKAFLKNLPGSIKRP